MARAAACERNYCKPDGYGCYVRNGLSFGFFLEYDRGTERARHYAARVRAYYRYRESGQAARDYRGFPTVLFVTTQPVAEHRMADKSYRAAFVRATEPLPILTTTVELVSTNPEGILGRFGERDPDRNRAFRGSIGCRDAAHVISLLCTLVQLLN